MILKVLIHFGKIYTGNTHESTRKQHHGENYKILTLYKKSGTNVSICNFFTTLPLIKHLLRQNFTMVELKKKNVCKFLTNILQ